MEIAKFSPPKLDGILTRARMIKILEENPTAKITWVSGAPGSGKTTLVADFIEQKQLRYIWYRLDILDNEVASFFHYFSKCVLERVSIELPKYIHDYVDDKKRFYQRYFSRLFDELTDDVIFVFDNYQELATESEWNEIVSYLIETLPNRSHLMVISRTEPPPRFAKYKICHQMAVISGSTINLHKDEVKALFESQGLASKYNRKYQKLIEKELHGWMIGAMLLMEQIKRGLVQANFSTLITDDVYAYFAYVVFSGIESDKKQIYLNTALLPQFDLDEAARLTNKEREQVKCALHELATNNLFIERRAAGAMKGEYAYHPLFRQFLLRTLEQETEDKELLSIKRRGAKILLDRENIEFAANLVLASKSWDLLNDLLQSLGAELITQGRGNVIQQWIAHISNETKDQFPWLWYWQGLSLLALNPMESSQYFERAYEAFIRDREEKGACLAWCGISDSYTQSWDDCHPLDKWLDKANFDYESYPIEIRAKLVSSTLAALIYRRPHSQYIGVWLQRARDLLPHVSGGAFVSNCCALIQHYIWTGNVRKASQIMDIIKPRVDMHIVSPSLLWLHGVLAFYNSHKGNEGETLNLLQQGIKNGNECGIHTWDYRLYMHGTVISLSVGDVCKAEEYLKKMAECLDPSRRFNFALYHLLSGALAALKKEYLTAELYIEQGQKLCYEVGIDYITAFSHQFLAELSMIKQDWKVATQQIEKLESIAKKMGSIFHLFQAKMLLSYLFFKQNKPIKGLRWLRFSIMLAKDNETLPLICVNREAYANLLSLALRHRIEEQYVCYIASVRKYEPPKSFYGLENWPWQLKIYTFGRFQLDRFDVNEQGINMRQKPIRVLKVLIALGGKSVPEASICKILWPGIDEEYAYKSLGTAIYRLRKMLILEKAILVENGTVSINNQICWVDCMTVDHWLAESDKVLEAGDIPSLRDILEQILQIYRGPFLKDEGDQNWLVPYRSRVHEKVLELCLLYGRYLEDSADWSEALKFYHHFQHNPQNTKQIKDRIDFCRNQL